MSRNQGTVAIFVLLAMLAIAVHVAYGRKPTPAGYEYKAVERPALDLAELNTLGAEGWNCYSVLPIEKDGKLDHFDVICNRALR